MAPPIPVYYSYAFFKNGVEIPNSRFTTSLPNPLGETKQLKMLCTVALNPGDIITINNVDVGQTAVSVVNSNVPATCNVNRVG